MVPAARDLTGALLLLALPSLVYAGGGDIVAPSPQPILYIIDGYLDAAPDGVRPQERTTIGTSGRMRTFLLTWYKRDGDTGDPWLLTNNLGAYEPDFLLIGRDTEVATIMDAAPGSHLSGQFQYLPSIHSLVINPYRLAVEPP
jgi:hypothetical protein